MPYNFAIGSFRTKKLNNRLSQRNMQFYLKKGHFAFFTPLFGGLEAVYNVHLRFIGKRIVDFL